MTKAKRATGRDIGAGIHRAQVGGERENYAVARVDVAEHLWHVSVAHSCPRAADKRGSNDERRNGRHRVERSEWKRADGPIGKVGRARVERRRDGCASMEDKKVGRDRVFTMEQKGKAPRRSTC